MLKNIQKLIFEERSVKWWFRWPFWTLWMSNKHLKTYLLIYIPTVWVWSIHKAIGDIFSSAKAYVWLSQETRSDQHIFVYQKVSFITWKSIIFINDSPYMRLEVDQRPHRRTLQIWMPCVKSRFLGPLELHSLNENDNKQKHCSSRHTNAPGTSINNDKIQERSRHLTNMSRGHETFGTNPSDTSYTFWRWSPPLSEILLDSPSVTHGKCGDAIPT